MSRDSVKVVKIGGHVVDSTEGLDKLLDEFAALEGNKILVHGGGKIATNISAALGIEAKMVEGRRITDAATVEVVTMVYAGGINKSIVAKLQRRGVAAWGICGADAQIIPAIKRPVKDIDYGFVGDVLTDSINNQALQMLIGSGYSVVVAPITVDAEGQLLNTNADTIAQSVAVAMSKIYDVELIYLFEKSGVLADIADDNSVIKLISHENYPQLKSSGKIFDGMIPKIDNALLAVDSGVTGVRICNTLRVDAGTLIAKI
ncbi:MAG: acetylglutamate kinase [Rikenellaceae bacterium]